MRSVANPRSSLFGVLLICGCSHGGLEKLHLNEYCEYPLLSDESDYFDLAMRQVKSDVAIKRRIDFGYAAPGDLGNLVEWLRWWEFSAPCPLHVESNFYPIYFQLYLYRHQPTNFGTYEVLGRWGRLLVITTGVKGCSGHEKLTWGSFPGWPDPVKDIKKMLDRLDNSELPWLRKWRSRVP